MYTRIFEPFWNFLLEILWNGHVQWFYLADGRHVEFI